MHDESTPTRSRIAIIALAVSIALPFAMTVSAAPTGRTFSSPDKAIAAAIEAIRDFDPKALESIFGKGFESLFESADPVQDEIVRSRFLELFDASHELKAESDGSMVLVVGPDGWPFPIPLVKTGKGWAFDTAAGAEEIINRRIGRNELRSIQSCLAVVDAQHDYYRRDRDGDGILEYAQRIVSTVGRQDGLFWPTEDEAEQSPLGELFAIAAAEGYAPMAGSYHGYKFRLLSSQGAAARDGAYDYLVRDDQIGGFALIAYPAAWGDSGIMTFIVNHDGVVYQRDFGPDTETETAKITSYDPGEGWTKVPETDLAPIPPQ